MGALKTTVPVWRVAVFAEVAFFEEQRDLQLICQHYSDDWEEQEEGAALMEPLSEAARDNLEQHLRAIGLLSRSGGLTKLGQQVAHDGEVPIPEQGVYRLWVTEHPLFGKRILHAERAPTKYTDREYKELDSLPAVPDPDPEKKFESVVDETSFVLRDYLDEGTGHRRTNDVRGRIEDKASCEIMWGIELRENQPDWSGWWLSGTLQTSEGSQDIQENKERVSDVGWSKLIRSWVGRSGTMTWEVDRRQLSVVYETVKDDEQALKTFEKGLEFREVRVPSYGEWEKAVIQNAPLVPDSSRDAGRWAQHLLTEKLKENGYVSRSDIERCFEELVVGSPLEPFEPEVPETSQLLEHVRREKMRSTYWHVAAPHDLVPA
jgi:hypothetical protein